MPAEPAEIAEPAEVAEIDAAVAHLVRLVDCDSTSGREEPAVAETLRIAAELGLAAQRLQVAPGRDNVLVGPRDARVLLCTHLDTVPPFIPASVVDGAVRGRGSADAKGVAVAMLYALARLTRAAQAAGTAPPAAAALFVVGEETDHVGAKAALGAGLRPTAIVLGEPCQNALAPAQKGLLKVRVSAQGQAGHSAYPELGASAVHRLVDALARLRHAALPEDPLLGRTTVNIGRIQGGLAANVIAPHAEAEVLIRCAAPVNAVLAAAGRALGEDVTVEETSRAEPLEFATPGTAGGVEIGVAVPFNTDAHTLSPLGARMVLVGPGDMRCAHSPDEHLPRADLATGIGVYVDVMNALL